MQQFSFKYFDFSWLKGSLSFLEYASLGEACIGLCGARQTTQVGSFFKKKRASTRPNITGPSALSPARCESNSSQWPPADLYWDGQCKPCPASLYKSDHCADGGVLVNQRACNGAMCEGQCTVPVRSGAPEPKFYWDRQCTACPAKLYKDSHCSEGGEIVEEKACGPVNAHCEAKCRLPQSSPAPKPKLYWDGQCTACPAHLYSHCSNGGTLVGQKGCGMLKVFCEGMLPQSRVGGSIYIQPPVLSWDIWTISFERRAATI